MLLVQSLSTYSRAIRAPNCPGVTELTYCFTKSMHNSLPLNLVIGSRAQVGRPITPYKNYGIGRDSVQYFPLLLWRKRYFQSSCRNSNIIVSDTVLSDTVLAPHASAYTSVIGALRSPFCFLSFRDLAAMLKEELTSDTISYSSRSKAIYY
jgi:hypothetical protein